ncbi:unnamed protein product, partial [Timema podura]|nr:unnamed protein product [Timema podura]
MPLRLRNNSAAFPPTDWIFTVVIALLKLKLCWNGTMKHIAFRFRQAAYDNVLNAKRAAKLRRQSLNSRFKKLRDDLEAREKKAEEAAKYNKHTNIGPRTCEEILKVNR